MRTGRFRCKEFQPIFIVQAKEGEEKARIAHENVAAISNVTNTSSFHLLSLADSVTRDTFVWLAPHPQLSNNVPRVYTEEKLG